MQTLLPMTTNVLASASPRALTTVELTASSGHKPSSCAQAGLRASTAFVKVEALATAIVLTCLCTALCRQSDSVGGDGGAADVVDHCEVLCG